jgi:hypothetical protein
MLVLCKAWTDRGVSYSAKGKVFNNVLFMYVRALRRPNKEEASL